MTCVSCYYATRGRISIGSISAEKETRLSSVTHWPPNSTFGCNLREESSSLLITVETRLTATPLMRSPRYYGHFLLAWQNGNTLSYIKKMLMRSLVNTTNGHCFKFQTPIVLYNITPLIQPLEKTKTRVTCQFHWWSLSFINQIAAGFLSFHYCATSSNIRLHKLRLTHWIIVVYNKEVEYEVFRTTPWRSVFIIKMACFFFSRNLLFVCGSL